MEYSDASKIKFQQEITEVDMNSDEEERLKTQSENDTPEGENETDFLMQH